MSRQVGLKTAALAVVYFFDMGRAALGHFRRESDISRGMRVTTGLAAAAFGWYLRERWSVATGRKHVPLWRDRTGSVAISAAFLLLRWAIAASGRKRLTLAFTPDEPTFLLKEGPYRWVRHPFYLSYILFWIGTAFQVRGRAYLVVPSGLACLYAFAARTEEAKFAASPLSAPYAAYRRDTGTWLPRPRGWAGRRT